MQIDTSQEPNFSARWLSGNSLVFLGDTDAMTLLESCPSSTVRWMIK